MNKLSHYDLWPKITLIITAVFLTAALNVPFVLKEIVRGAPIHGANGLMFDAQDNLYIASVWGREIVVMNPLNGEIIDRLGTEVGVESPDDLTFGPDGSLYWTSIITGEVGRLSPGGVRRDSLSPKGLTRSRSPMTAVSSWPWTSWATDFTSSILT